MPSRFSTSTLLGIAKAWCRRAETAKRDVVINMVLSTRVTTDALSLESHCQMVDVLCDYGGRPVFYNISVHHQNERGPRAEGLDCSWKVFPLDPFPPSSLRRRQWNGKPGYSHHKGRKESSITKLSRFLGRSVLPHISKRKTSSVRDMLRFIAFHAANRLAHFSLRQTSCRRVLSPNRALAQRPSYSNTQHRRISDT